MEFLKNNIKLCILLFTLFLFVSGYLISRAVVIPPYYDLKVEDFELVPIKPYVNQPCKIIVKIKNNGTKALLTSQGLSTYQYIFDDFQMTKLSYVSPNYDNMVLAGGYANYTFEGKFTSEGEKSLYFKIDTIDELDESKIGDDGFSVSLEDNNEKTKTVTIYSPEDIDLKVNSIEIDKDYPLVNEEIEFTIKVKNTGLTSITDSQMLSNTNIEAVSSGFAVTNSTADEYPTIDNPLDPNELFAYTYTGNYNSTGNKNFTFRIDKKGYVAESDETNNSSSTELRIYLNNEEAYSLNFLSYEIIKVSSSSLKVNWKTSKESTGRVYYDKYDYNEYISKLIKEESGSKTDHTVTLTGLESGTMYYINLAGTVNSVISVSDTIDFATPPNNNVSITSGPSVIINGNTATVSWETDLLSRSILNYKKAGAALYTKKSSDSLVVDHEQTIPNLTEGTYNYYVISSTTFLTGVQSGVMSFTYGGVAQETPTTNTAAETTSSETNQNQTTAINEKTITNTSMYSNLKGKILLTVEANGEAYWVNPTSMAWHYLGRPEDAFAVMREQGIGIINANLEKIPIGLGNLTGTDTDGDGLTDMLEDAIGTDKSKEDSDNDGYSDKSELEQGFNPRSTGSLQTDINFANNHLGKIFLQVEGSGEAWYVNPADAKRYFLGRPADAFNVMRYLGLGISNENFNKL